MVNTSSTPQQTWDWVKVEVKTFTISFQISQNNWKGLKRLQSKRNKMIRQNKTRGLYFQILETVEAQMGSLQDSLVEIEIFKSGKFWRDSGEKSVGTL